MDAVDLHQHLWPASFVELLRRRTHAPYLRDWQLVTDGEPPYEIRPQDHEVGSRIAQDHRAGIGLACVSLSAPLGIESLPRDEAGALIEAWHAGVQELPDHFAAWASVPAIEPDLRALTGLLAGSFVGVQLPATSLVSPAGWEALGDVLRVAELAGTAGVRPSRPDAALGVRPRLVGTRGGLRRPAAGRLVGLARVRWAPAVPPAARSSSPPAPDSHPSTTSG